MTDWIAVAVAAAVHCILLSTDATSVAHDDSIVVFSIVSPLVSSLVSSYCRTRGATRCGDDADDHVWCILYDRSVVEVHHSTGIERAQIPAL